MLRMCCECGVLLTRDNPGVLCFDCQEDRRGNLAPDNRPYYDAKDMARILGLESDEEVKRLARQKKLPPRIPAVRKCLWHKEVVERWIRGDGQLPLGSAEQLAALVGAHGGVHFDEAAGCWKFGKPEEISVVIVDRNGTKVKKVTEFIPGHYDST